MKIAAFAVVFLLFAVSSIFAQFVSPVPIVEIEVRDNSSLKMRSVELDRIKRDARKPNAEKLGPASVNHFLEIKEDFEKIQKLEADIVTTYTTGKQIEYSKIAGFAADLNTSAARLKTNLFTPPDTERQTPDASKTEDQKTLPGEVKSLIVALDDAIGAFINSPIFQNSKKAKPLEKEQAEKDLEQIIKVSAALKAASEKQTQAKN